MNNIILLIEENSIIADKISKILLKDGVDLNFTDQPEKAIELIKENNFNLVLSSIKFQSAYSGHLFETIKYLKPDLKIVVLLDPQAEGELVAMINNELISGYIYKPINENLVSVIVSKNLKSGKNLISSIHVNHELEKSLSSLINGLSSLAELKDPEPGNHVVRVKHFSRLLAQSLQKKEKFRNLINEKYLKNIFLFSPLHDIGKIGIPDKILLKQGRLTDDEFDVMKRHTIIGGDSLDYSDLSADTEMISFCRDIVYYHHEKFNGLGYPFHLAGENIPLSARIVSLSDAYDAITSNRPYEEAKQHKIAIERIVKDAGHHFDPEIVEAFMEVEKEFEKYKLEYSDENLVL